MKKIIAVILLIFVIFTSTTCSKTDKYSQNLQSSQSSQSASVISSSQSKSQSVSSSSNASGSAKSSSISVANNEGGNLTAVDPNSALNTAELMNINNDKHGWGAGYGKNGAQPSISSKTKDYFKSLNTYCIGSKDSKKNYLTFDEGYENGYTAKILDTLKEKNVKALFFVTKPYAQSNKDLVRRMINEGHIVGNHSVSHKSFPSLTLDKVESEVMDLHRYMLSEFDYDMYLFRYPNGEYSDRTLSALDQLGYITVFWSFAYKDYDTSNQLGEDYAHEMVTSHAHNGAVYLLHAVSKDNANALPRIIDTLRGKGFEFSLYEGIPE